MGPYLNKIELASEKLVPGFFNVTDPNALKEIGERLKNFYFDDIHATKYHMEQLYNVSRLLQH